MNKRILIRKPIHPNALQLKMPIDLKEPSAFLIKKNLMRNTKGIINHLSWQTAADNL